MAFKRGAPASNSNEVEILLDLKKQVTVRKYNNVNLVDIREFYTDRDGVKRPGKKGISLTEDTYYKLLEATNKIQNALDDLNGGALNKRVKLDKKRKDMKNHRKRSLKGKLSLRRSRKVNRKKWQRLKNKLPNHKQKGKKKLVMLMSR